MGGGGCCGRGIGLFFFFFKAMRAMTTNKMLKSRIGIATIRIG
jgi:hypothetical protein